VLGVLPADFELLLPGEAFLLEHSDAWVPLQYDYEQAPPRNYTSFTVIGRLAGGRSHGEGQAEVSAIAARLRERHPVHRNSKLRAEAVPLQHDVTKGAAPALLTLLGAVGLVLLVACANAAHLLLARGASRRREIAMRVALGAGRGRIVRRLLAESGLIAAAAALAGLLLAWGLLEAVIALRPAGLPRLTEIALDPAALGFAFAAASLSVLLAGLVPAIDATRTDLALLLRRGQGATGDPGSRRLGGGLVIAELAVTLVLLVGAGLLLRSFAALQEVRPGFDPERTLTFQLALPRDAYPEEEEVHALRRRLEQELLALPGVEAVGTTSQLPLAGSGALQPYAWNEETARNWESVTADGRWISPGYLPAMGTRLLAGRHFEESDVGAVPRVVVIDEVVARRAFSGGDAIGRQLQIEPDGTPDRFATVIGVAEHQYLHELSRPGLGQIWSPGGWRRLDFALRSGGDPGSLAAPVRRVVASVDPALPVSALRPMSAYVAEELARSRFTLLLMSGFGLVALLLAAVGAAGVMARSVIQRRREIGIRLALGASPLRVCRELVAGGLRLLGSALAVGLGVAALLSPGSTPCSSAWGRATSRPTRRWPGCSLRWGCSRAGYPRGAPAAWTRRSPCASPEPAQAGPRTRRSSSRKRWASWRTSAPSQALWPSSRSKASRVTTLTVTGSRAVTVAVLGSALSSAVSPKTSPGCSVRSSSRCEPAPR
jgi:predicted permease